MSVIRTPKKKKAFRAADFLREFPPLARAKSVGLRNLPPLRGGDRDIRKNYFFK